MKTLMVLLSLLVIVVPGARAGYLDDARYGFSEVREKFFSDGTELPFALQFLTTACLSESMAQVSPTPVLEPPCDTYVELLREGCAGDDDANPQLVCAGLLVERETVRQHGGWKANLKDLLRLIEMLVRAPQALGNGKR